MNCQLQHDVRLPAHFSRPSCLVQAENDVLQIIRTRVLPLENRLRVLSKELHHDFIISFTNFSNEWKSNEFTCSIKIQNNVFYHMFYTTKIWHGFFKIKKTFIDALISTLDFLKQSSLGPSASLTLNTARRRANYDRRVLLLYITMVLAKDTINEWGLYSTFRG